MSRPIKILVNDIGETSGLIAAKVTFSNEQANKPKFNIMHFDHYLYEDRHTWVPELIRWMKWDYLIVEDFLVYPDKAQSLIHDRLLTVRLIGMYEYVANIHNYPIHFQLASEVSRTKINIPDFQGVHLHHCRQALPHLRYFVIKHRHRLFEEFNQ